MRMYLVPRKTPVVVNAGGDGTTCRLVPLSSYFRIDGRGYSNEFLGWIVAVQGLSITNGMIYTRVKTNRLCYAWNLGVFLRGKDPLEDVEPFTQAKLEAYLLVIYNKGSNLCLKRGNTGLGSYTVGQWKDAWFKLYASGTTIKGKSWQPGSSEPNWQISVTDSGYSSGLFGWYVHTSIPDQSSYGNGLGYLYPLGVDFGGTNPPTSGNLKTISGQVTLGGSPVQGATVIAVRQDYDFSAPGIPGVDFAKATTDENGNYTISLDCDTGPYAVFAFYESGGTKYTDQAKVYIEV